MDAIIKEKISADHLLYVSLKYTKTCDVIINLLLRWKIMIEMAMDVLVERVKKEKKWKPVPDAPRAKLIQLKKVYGWIRWLIERESNLSVDRNSFGNFKSSGKPYSAFC
jgi:hypothetical protein